MTYLDRLGSILLQIGQFNLLLTSVVGSFCLANSCYRIIFKRKL